MPDNTDIHVGTGRIKLGWIPEGEFWEGKGVGDPRKLRCPEYRRESLRKLGRRYLLPYHRNYLNISANIVGSSLKPGPPA